MSHRGAVLILGVKHATVDLLMYGVPNFEPNFFRDPHTLIEVLGAELNGLIGKTFEDYWVMWDLREDVHYTDGPVVLKIGGEPYEFVARDLDKFSITRARVDLLSPLDWYGAGDELPLAWRTQTETAINQLIGRTVSGIDILLYALTTDLIFAKESPSELAQSHTSAQMLHGLELAFETDADRAGPNYLQIWNALDATGISSSMEVAAYEGLTRVALSLPSNRWPPSQLLPSR
ncbi:MAG: hypothetical protein IPL79_00230 [Myxococcales bacterium]|nr:hypothetical protein [Myxococcales bacterium]